ncbi:MAG: aldehyde-activating protein [Alphaproteobacteria bacterium]|nr:aldehyde-activating protein [Alphaproteobacteria bacterium]
MANVIEGGCRCGAVRYALASETMPRAYACHCLDCQTWSGSAFSLQVVVSEGQLSVSGPVVIYELTTPSGHTSRQRMCGVCHTRIFNTNSSRPGIAVVRAGTFDASDQLDVVAHIWTKRKQRWVAIPDSAAQWDETAPPAEFVSVLAQR